MEQKRHHFEIRPRDPNKPMTGANTEVFMDGEKLTRCTRVAFEVQAGGVATITLDFIGTVAVAGVIGDLQTNVIPLVPKKK